MNKRAIIIISIGVACIAIILIFLWFARVRIFSFVGGSKGDKGGITGDAGAAAPAAA